MVSDVLGALPPDTGVGAHRPLVSTISATPIWISQYPGACSHQKAFDASVQTSVRNVRYPFWPTVIYPAGHDCA